MNRSKRWLQEDLRLIEIVKKYPYLHLRKRDQKVNDLWDAVAMEYGCPVDRCRSRWRNIKRVYKTGKYKNNYFRDGTLSFLDESPDDTSSSKEIGETIPTKRTENTQTVECISKNTVSDVGQVLANRNESSSVSSFPNTSSVKGLISGDGKETQSNSNKTVLTLDIINYLLKAKSDESSEKDCDIFQSIAKFVPETPKKSLNTNSASDVTVVNTKRTNTDLAPDNNPGCSTLHTGGPVLQNNYMLSNEPVIFIKPDNHVDTVNEDLIKYKNVTDINITKETLNTTPEIEAYTVVENKIAIYIKQESIDTHIERSQELSNDIEIKNEPFQTDLPNRDEDDDEGGECFHANPPKEKSSSDEESIIT